MCIDASGFPASSALNLRYLKLDENLGDSPCVIPPSEPICLLF